MKIIDISSPTSPKVTGVVDTNGTATYIVQDGDYCYVSNRDDNFLDIIDISDKENPIIVGSIAYGYYRIIKKDNYIYGGTITSVDVSDPTNPTYTDSVTGTNFVTGTYSILSRQAFAIVANHIISFNETIDITDPTNMQVDNGFSTFGGSVSNLKIVNNIAYMASGSRGLTLLDMSDLSNITYKANLNYGLFLTDISVGSDGFVYGISRDQIFKIDVDTKTSPFIPLKGLSSGYNKIVDEDFLYNVSYNILTISSIDDVNITQISTLEITELGQKGITDIVKSKDILIYLYPNGIGTIDVNDSENPKNLGTLDIDGYMNDIKIDGNYAYIAAENKGIKIVDISDPKNLELVGSLGGDLTYVTHIEKKDNYLFVGGTYLRISGNPDYGNMYGISIIDISDVTNPIFVKYFTTDKVSSIKIDGNCLYANNKGSLEIYDILTASEPKKVTQVSTSIYDGQMVIVGNYLLTTPRNHSYAPITITDITSKEYPKRVGYFYDAGYIQQVVDNRLFTSKYIFDVSKLRGE